MSKGPDAFRTISEVGEDLDIPQHVLRFWETRFTSIRPLKRGGGRRYYRPDDVELLKGIRLLLYGQGYTIKGVQRILKENGPRFVQAVGRGEQAAGAPRPLPSGEEEAPDGHELEDAASFELAEPHGPEEPRQLTRPQPAFDRDDRERLRAALDELLECERILGALREP